MMPLHDFVAAVETGEETVIAYVAVQRDLVDADLSFCRQANVAAERLRQKLMTQTEADIRLAALRHPLADGLHLAHKPGILLELPHIHGAAQDEHEVEILEGRKLLAFPQADRSRLNAIGHEKVEETAGRIVVHMLQNERSLHDLPLLTDAGPAKASARPAAPR